MDKDGWYFTQSGKYMVKSAYEFEQSYPDGGCQAPCLGPDVKALQAYSWKIKCSPKLKHFLWQIISGCLPVKKNLKARGIKRDLH